MPRKKVPLISGGFTGFILGMPLIGLLYLGGKLMLLPFAPYNLFDGLSRILPGHIIAAGINAMVRVIRGFGLGRTDVAAKSIEHLLAIISFLLLAAAAGAILAALLRFVRGSGTLWGAFLGAAIALSVALGGLPDVNRPTAGQILMLTMLLIAWASVLGAILDASVAPLPGGDRRTASPAGRGAPLVKLAVPSVTIAVAGLALGELFSRQNVMTGADRPLTDLRADTKAPAIIGATLAARRRTGIAPAPGTRPEMTPLEKFYRIDIDQAPPLIDGKSWRLAVSGLFDRPRDLMLPDIVKFPEVTQAATLSCISNPIGGDLISTGFFTGIRLRDLLDTLGIQRSAHALVINAADGYYESVEERDMRDPRTLLVYGLGDRTLSAAQGFPLRIFIPDRYGMKQPKWITRIRAAEKAEKGYWVDRGWSMEARPRLLSIIDNVARDHVAGGLVPIGGIAYAGARGIRSVELSVDHGAWMPARLLNPPLGPLTWVLWRYDWPLVRGRHTFTVRATDSSGTVQTGTPGPPDPSGATGYHTVRVKF